MCAARVHACPLFVGSTGAARDTSDTGGDDLEPASLPSCIWPALCRHKAPTIAIVFPNQFVYTTANLISQIITHEY